jgi:hypothetical protein
MLIALSGCGVIGSTPEPEPGPGRPRFSFEVLVDLGIFGGPPAPPPPYSIGELEDGTALVVVDRGNVHQVRRARLAGERWESLGGFDRPLLPGGDGPLLRRLAVGPDDGFETDALLLIGRIPNGPINQIELSVDGEVRTIGISQKPVVVLVFPAGTELGDTYTTLDAGTHRFGVEPLLPDE